MRKVELQPVDEAALVTTGTPLLSALLDKDLHVLMSCGGKGICSTCHVHVREGMGELSAAEPREQRTLSLLADRRVNSRLACQARVIGDGIVVDVPDGMYIERAEDLLTLLGTHAARNILHPVTGAVLIPKGKIVTRTLLEQSRGLEQEVGRLKAGDSGVLAGTITTFDSRTFLASGAGWPAGGSDTTRFVRPDSGRTARPGPRPSVLPPPGSQPSVRLPPPSGSVALPTRLPPSTATPVPQPRHTGPPASAHPDDSQLSATAPQSVEPARRARARLEPLQTGTQVDKYLLLEEVGRGGAGVVFRALHTKLKTPVAIKFLRPDVLSSDPQAHDRFTREAQMLARLIHPNVVRVLDFEDSQDRPYVVMEYVDGASAADLLRQVGRVAPERAVDILQQVVSGLAAAHKLGIVHRDVKPGNILAARGGLVKLVDLGLAVVARQEAPSEPKRGGAIEGTVAYMSPEQLVGDAVDHRSDIYSLGATAYHLLTGRLPFPGRSTAEVMMGHLRTPVVPPHEVIAGLPAPLSRLVVTMLAKAADDRFQTYAEVRRALAAAAGA